MVASPVTWPVSLGRVPPQARAAARGARDPETLAGRHPRHPSDLARRDDDGHRAAARARDLAVGEEVLEAAAAAEAERPHAVPGPPRADLQRRGERRGVER